MKIWSICEMIYVNNDNKLCMQYKTIHVYLITGIYIIFIYIEADIMEALQMKSLWLVERYLSRILNFESFI